jgi:hypothetical protein
MNIAGPVLDIVQSKTASQLYIVGGKDVLIFNSLFTDNKGSAYIFDQLDRRKLAKYFPSDFFALSNSPLINIQLTPPSKVKYPVSIDFQIQAT